MDNKFSDRLIQARKKKGLSQKDAAQILGITPVTLNRYEKAHREPERGVILKISELYNCDVTWLLTGESTKEVCEPIRLPYGDLYLTEKEQALLDFIRKFSEDEQDKLIKEIREKAIKDLTGEE